MFKSGLFTSESVTAGHPDKICDQISDAILDAYMVNDRNSRVACECFAGKGFILIGGEITSTASVDVEHIARSVVRRIGYTNTNEAFNADGIEVINKLNGQSPDISIGVTVGGAGDQGMMFGYACNETSNYMPSAIHYAHALTKRLEEYRVVNQEAGKILRPDGKAQVTVRYDNRGKVSGIDTILISTQHADNVSLKLLKEMLKEHVINRVIPKELLSSSSKILVNPTGRFVIGGPEGDTGLTGRKIIVDTYGGMGRHGGGCFSGKDPTKVDRSGAYMARQLAKSIVACEAAPACEVQLAYAIGVAEPVSINVNLFGHRGLQTELDIAEKIHRKTDLTPRGIIDSLLLRETEYEPLAAYGHMGRTKLGVMWEQINTGILD